MHPKTLETYKQIIENELLKLEIKDVSVVVLKNVQQIHIDYTPTDTILNKLIFKDFEYSVTISDMPMRYSSNLEVFREAVETNIKQIILPYIIEQERKSMEATCKLCKELTGPAHHSGCGYNCYDNPSCAWYNNGVERKSEPLKEGSTKSNIKINPTEKNLPSIPKNLIAPPPPSKPKPPLTRIIQEGKKGDCPSCKSSRVRRYLTGSLLQFGDYLGCINPHCENYYIKTI